MTPFWLNANRRREQEVGSTRLCAWTKQIAGRFGGGPWPFGGFLRVKQTGMYASLNVGYQKGNQIKESFIVRKRNKQKRAAARGDCVPRNRRGDVCDAGCV